MRSPFATLQSLKVPPGPGPGVIIGGRIPAELVAYYAPQTVRAAIIYQKTSTVYEWEVLVDTGTSTFTAFGVTAVYTVTATPYVAETYRVTILDTSLGGYSVLDIGLKSSTGGQRSHMSINTGSALLLDGTLLAGGLSLIQVNGQMQIDGRSAPRGTLGANMTDAVDVASSTGSEVAVASADWDSEPDFTFGAGRLYRITVTGLIRQTGGNVEHQARLRVRVGAESTTGTVLASWLVPVSATSQRSWSFSLEAYARNSTGSTAQTELSLTCQRLAGNGAVSLLSDSAANRLRVLVEDIGLASQQPGLETVPSVA